MNQLTDLQLDTLTEFISIGVGRAAQALNEMVNAHVNLQVPFVKVLTLLQLREEMQELNNNRLATVKLGFSGPFSGTAAIVFPPDSASKLVAVLTGEEPGTPDLDAVRAGTLSEVGNIVLNGVMGSIGNIIKARIVYSLPVYMEDTVESLLAPEKLSSVRVVLLVRTHFIIRQHRIEGDIILLFGVGSFDALLAALDDTQKTR